MSGFHHAGITKGMIVAVSVTTLVAALTDSKPYLHLQLVPHMTKYRQYWRILTYQCAFANSTELVLGVAVLWSTSRTIERSFGPRKFVAFLLLSWLLTTALCLAGLIAGHILRLGPKGVAAGPYGILFSLLYQYHRLVPAVYQFRICGVVLSPKSLTYLLAAQLPILHPSSTLLPISAALISSYIYTLDPLSLPSSPLSRRRHLKPLHTYRFPRSLLLLFSRALQPLFGGQIDRSADSTDSDGAAGGGGVAPGGTGSAVGTRGPRRGHRTIPGQVSSEQRGRMGMMARIWNGSGTGTGAGAGGGSGMGTGTPRAAGTMGPQGGLEAQLGRRRVEEIRERVEREVAAAREVARQRVGEGGGSSSGVGSTFPVAAAATAAESPVQPASASAEVHQNSAGWGTVPNSPVTQNHNHNIHAAAEGTDRERAATAATAATASVSAFASLPSPRALTTPAQLAPGRIERRTTTERAQAARTALGEWVSEIAGAGVRVPSEQEISALSSMFPTTSRERIIQALQRSNNDTAQAVEALLAESS